MSRRAARLLCPGTFRACLFRFGELLLTWVCLVSYYPSGAQVPEATFAFLNNNGPNNVMTLAQLPSAYKGLKNVTIGVVNGATQTALTVLQIDDLSHCNYS